MPEYIDSDTLSLSRPLLELYLQFTYNSCKSINKKLSADISFMQTSLEKQLSML